jgi:hypothetical protein
MTEKQAIGLPNFLKSRLFDWAGKSVEKAVKKPSVSKGLNQVISSATESAIESAGKKLGPAFERHIPEIGNNIGESVVRGAEKRIEPLFEEKIFPALRKIQKEIPKTVTTVVEHGVEQLADSAADLSRSLSAAAALGSLSGAATAPEGERAHGAVRGAIGGLLGAAAGASWGRLLPEHSLLPAAGGAILGGIIGGGTLRDWESPRKTTNNEGTFGDPGMTGSMQFGKESSMEGHKYAGVTIDWYDDEGMTLKGKFPTLDKVPEIIKEASVLPKEKLANEDFALIMVDRGYVFRKYACVDPGTTTMSVIYFMEHGDKLPETAQKVAASNLLAACLHHGLLPPATLTKAAGVGKYIIPVGGTLAGAAGGGAAAGEGHRLEGALLGGAAGAGGSTLARNALRGPVSKKLSEYAKSVSPRIKIKGKPSVAALENAEKKMSRAARVATAGLAVPSIAAGGLAGNTGVRALKSLTADEEAQKISSVVDVTGQRPKQIVKVAKPMKDEDYAVVMEDGTRKYPIHTWDMVKKAEDYFLENSVKIQPEIRRQFAVKLAAKAFTMGYPVAIEIANLGSTHYADENTLRDAIDMRKVACAPKSNAREFLDELFKKKASIYPEIYSECLKRFDINEGLDKGWDHIVPDPWASTFGKAAAKVVWESGADIVTEDALTNLAENRLDLIIQKFTYTVGNEFRKDPIGIFNSMPDPQKRLIARMASDAESDGMSGERGISV